MTITITAPLLPPPDLSTLTGPPVYAYDASGAMMMSITSHPNPVPAALDRAATMAGYQAAWTAACAPVITAHQAAGTQPAAAEWPPAPPLVPIWLAPPPGSTLIAPPAPQAGFWPVFTSGAWTMVEDHRGASGWDASGNPVRVLALGPLPAGFTTLTPASVTAAALAQAKTAALAGVIAYADRLTAQITSTYPSSVRASWPKQELEAMTWLAAQAASPATTPPTPLLTGIIAAKAVAGVATPAAISAVTAAEITALAQAVMAAATNYESLVTTVIGLTSGAATAINAAPDQATLAASLATIEAAAAAAALAHGLTP